MAARKQVDDLIVAALAGGQTYAEAARTAGCSERHVQGRMAEPAVRQRVVALRTAQVEAVTNRLSAACVRAVDVLVDVLDELSRPYARVQAARALLELSAKWREVHDIEQRLTAIEQALATNKQAGAV